MDFATFMAARDQGSPARWRTEQEEFGTFPGWSEYQGPMPGGNEMSNGRGEITCPTCHGDGYDLHEGNECRACGGEGKLTPTDQQNAREPQVKRHDYPSTQTKVPFVGSYQRPSALELGVACPSCTGATKLAATKNQHLQAIWRCASCGPLANLDAHPEVNPFDRSTHARGRTAKKITDVGRGEGKVWPMLRSVHAANPGLNKAQALTLVLATLTRYPEGR